jgi:hypothetical protein
MTFIELKSIKFGNNIRMIKTNGFIRITFMIKNFACGKKL